MWRNLCAGRVCREPNWGVSVVWSGQYTENAEHALFGFRGGEKKRSFEAAKVQLVWYTMWDPNICLQQALLSPQLGSLGLRLDSMAAPQQSGCGYTAQTSGPF